jgi:small subunit ribosomal protein S21
MLIIKNDKGDNIERMLKKFKIKYDKTGVLKELRKRKEFTKPSIKKREIKNKAIYIQKLKTNLGED